VAPWLRAASLAVIAWGLVTLLAIPRRGEDAAGAKAKGGEPTRLVFVGDLSPSMYLQDAGPEGKQTRQERMRDVVDGILQRVGGNLRYGVIAFYTEALPVVMEARDPELVRNVFNGLPLIYAMPVGQTDLGTSLNATLDLVRDYPPQSTRMIIFTDGDSVNLAPIAPRPKSVKQVLIFGLGNPHKGFFIDGHQSRQEGDVLQRVATALSGTYEDVNEKHASTAALADLVVTAPLRQRGLTLAEWAVLAIVLGAAIYALIPVALQYWGSDWEIVKRPEETAQRRALATR
jgi:Ca-activated chloride channel family protein